MNSFRRHVPTFVDGRDGPPAPIPFATTQDLLALDAVQTYAHPDPDQPAFSHFAKSDQYLMAIFDDGFSWWCVGYIEKPDDVDLPRWDGGRYRARLATGDEVVLSGSDVRAVCEGTLWLRDGSTATDLKYKRG